LSIIIIKQRNREDRKDFKGSHDDEDSSPC